MSHNKTTKSQKTERILNNEGKKKFYQEYIAGSDGSDDRKITMRLPGIDNDS